MERRTKIVATIGPASDDPSTLRALIAAGVNVARLSLSHADVAETMQRITRVREAADAEGAVVGVLADLPGPKIRVAEFPEGGIHLVEGSTVVLVPADGDDDRSTAGRIAVHHPPVLDDIRPRDRITIGDGAIQLLVDSVDGGGAVATVLTGGWVQGRPGVALPTTGAGLTSPTADDLAFLDALAPHVDAVAVSFVRSVADIQRARTAIPAGGPMLIAKIETQEAVDCAEDVIAAADGVMVARGDLGIRCAIEDVPLYQKRIIRTGVAYGRPVITATQMLESMVRAPMPTRAEVSDVANAVFDGTSALMLSGETAIGQYPVLVVETMSRIARRAEQDFDYRGWGSTLGRQQTVAGHATGPDPVTAAVSAAGWRAAIDADVAAIIACTNSGATARSISRFRPTVPLLAVTPSLQTVRQLALAWGITPMLADRHGSTDDIVWFAVKAAAEGGYVTSGQLVAVLVGSPVDPNPVTDTLRIVRVS